MSTINEDWKTLRPLIGNFISKLDSLTKGCEDVETLLKKVEKKSYEKGLSDSKKDLCNDCELHKFYNSCKGYYNIIDIFLHLSSDSRHLVVSLIDKLGKVEDLI
ncbi:MAG: hypothetical protein IJZ36_02830 [Bacilli bacterium]|nr:hypothetical protein [Bacilli bacterium]